ncbi:hypothetical protein J2Z83_001398 [Virgibacillus natechei]|uniref:DUF4064 domain-containing protein n=1 Tax=Virgibacillus natechei TaxID=1216297 RepID=A0ABS4IH09_9BACI|nr:hypothetical protein [Virgibacillus natechei]MBP1969294.1 hypothetical protein [Virgibacillus natechei]UZD12449.1 hypothetical protein OLD84_16295 [Virgibacillus natechei]
MNRGLERKLLIIGSIWNLFTSLLTIFSYNTWFNKEGAQQLQNADFNLMITGTQLIDNLSRVILTFGLFMFVGSIVNFLVALKMQDNIIQYKVLIWIFIWGIVQLFSMDIIGFVIFLIAFVIYLSKNKAVNLSKMHIKAIIT